MFARASTIYAAPENIDAGIAYVNHTVMPAMSHIYGFVGLSLMVERTRGRCIATSAWRDEDAMHASSERVEPIREGAAGAFGGRAEVDEWDVYVMHRLHHSRTGTCARVVWLKSDPTEIKDAIDTFRMATLAQIEDLPGFCSASLMVNETTGRSVVTTGYDDRESLERSRGVGADVRDEASRAMAADVLDVGEFDLVIAHLHIPEMV